jgi:hypoxanthine phosphoribosyltransferase
MTDKLYITAADLLQDSMRLGLSVLNSDFRPNFIVGVWRGGTPVGIAVQEVLHVHDLHSDHIAIRTSSYQGIGQRGKEVKVHGLDYLVARVSATDRLLIVDDVFDTGLSVEAILHTLTRKARRNTPQEIRIATPWFKPENNQTSFKPDYYLHETDQWLVFPHELEGLSREEIRLHKPDIHAVYEEYGR